MNNTPLLTERALGPRTTSLEISSWSKSSSAVSKNDEHIRKTGNRMSSMTGHNITVEAPADTRYICHMISRKFSNPKFDYDEQFEEDDVNESIISSPKSETDIKTLPNSGLAEYNEQYIPNCDPVTSLGLSDEDPLENSSSSLVRSAVSTVDNTTLSINTPRMWFLSLAFAVLGSSVNLFFSLRYPSVYVSPIIALLLAHPIGLLWDRILKRQGDPDDEFKDGDKVYHNLQEKGLRRLRLWLGQGRWNEKEHSCVYISSNVSFGFAFATDVIVEQTMFYNQTAGIVYQILLTLSSQILGYAFAGMARQFLVRPSGMIWPGTLMSTALFTTLHKEENVVANGWKITRWRFFFIVWACSFIFYFLPGLLIPALSYFSVITWIWPKNVVIANLFGVTSGLGLFPVTFDWAQIAYIGSPLLTPFWAALNVVGGLVIVMWIIAPIAYYSNAFHSSYMPILSSSVFDNTGNVYNVTKILTHDFLIDKKAYQEYSKVYLPITYVLSYSLQFAALASLLSYTTCWHGRDIWKQWKQLVDKIQGRNNIAYQPLQGGERSSRGESFEGIDSNIPDSLIFREDIHNRLMSRYKDAPMSWYLIIFIFMTGIGMFVCE